MSAAANPADYLRRKQAWLDWQALPGAAERRDWLRQLELDDPALAAALKAQLAASDTPLPLLDQGVLAANRADVAQPALQQYRFVRELGRGGMGRVWLAERQLGDATQQVALKQIVHAQWDADDRRRFERERRILARLNHPLIAGLVDGGSDADGAPFLATVYVDGERIDRHVARTAPTLAERVALVEQVAQAVAYAHRQLVVHRDLKPANILVDRSGTPRLLDFGVARLLAEEAITATGSSQLTLRYAAPEQLSDSALAEGAGVGCDIHALGLLLYELIRGESPWAAAGNDPQALIAAILNQVPARLSTRGGTGVDADLDAIVAMALRKRPEDRYPSADALAEDFGRWRRREPVQARRGERG